MNRRSLKLGGRAWCVAWLVLAVGAMDAQAASGIAVVTEGRDAPRPIAVE